MARVFLSYAHDDLDRAGAIAGALDKAGQSIEKAGQDLQDASKGKK